MRYDERLLITLGDPRGSFCEIRGNAGSNVTRGVLALTGNIIIWDQRHAPPIAILPNEILRSFHCPFRWSFDIPLSNDEEAAACIAATMRLHLPLQVLNA